jgi:hypothetical protein
LKELITPGFVGGSNQWPFAGLPKTGIAVSAIAFGLWYLRVVHPAVSHIVTAIFTNFTVLGWNLAKFDTS